MTQLYSLNSYALWKGLALVSVGKYKRAFEAHEKALQLDPNFKEGWCHMAQVTWSFCHIVYLMSSSISDRLCTCRLELACVPILVVIGAMVQILFWEVYHWEFKKELIGILGKILEIIGKNKHRHEEFWKYQTNRQPEELGNNRLRENEK